MKIDFQRQDGLKARMTLVMDYADYGPKVEENTRNYSKKMAIKGFRSGKTPKSVLTKMYGKGILEETVQKLLNDKLFAYLDENKIEYFGSPMIVEDTEPNDFNPKAQNTFTFVFDLGLKPQFSLQYGMEEPLPILIPELNHKAIDEDIIRYRRIFGSEENITDGEIEANDRIGVNLQAIHPDGSLSETIKDTVIDLERVTGDATSILLHHKLNDSLDVELDSFLGYARSVVVKNTLGLEEDPAPDQPLKYKVTITSIKRPQVTELTGEQISKVVGREMKDEAEFRQMLESRESGNIESRVEDMKKMSIRLHLLQVNPFDIPESFLLEWVNRQREKKMEAGSREANQFFKDTRWSFLLNRVMDDKKLEVTEKDVQKQVTNWVVQNVNYNQVDIRKYLKKLYENEYFMSSMRENAMEEVVFRELLPAYTYTERTGSETEFEKAYHDLHHEIFDHGDHHDHDHDHSHDHDHDLGHEHSHEHHEHSHT